MLSCEVIKIRYLTNSNESRETNSTYTYSSSNDSNSEIEAENETENYINNSQINSNDILSKFNNFINSSQNSNNENDDNCIINPFFIKTKWNLLLESFANKKELYNLVQINTEEEDFHNLYLMINLYKEHVFNLINENEDFTLMRWLISERGSISTLPTKGFKDLQEESSVEKYIKLIQKIILGLYQISSNLCNGITIELNSSVSFELNLLKQNSIQYSNNPTEEVRKKIIENVHVVLKNLFMVKRKINKSINEFILIKFLIFTCLSMNGNFNNLSVIGHHVA